jgi:hypothetical protein
MAHVGPEWSHGMAYVGVSTPEGPEIRLEGVNRANLKFTNLNTTTSRVSVRNKNESEREDAKQIVSK